MPQKARPGTPDEWAEVLRNEGLTVKIVSEFLGNASLSFDELKSIATEAMLVAVQTFDPSRGSFSHHAWGVVSNALRTSLKTEASEQASPLDFSSPYIEEIEADSTETSSSPGDVLPSSKERLREALKALDDSEARIVFEYYFLNWSIREIAADMNWPKTNVHRSLNAAMEKLRSFFTEKEAAA